MLLVGAPFRPYRGDVLCLWPPVDQLRRARKWGSFLQVMRSAQVESAVDARPLTKDDLVEYMRSGCKPPSKWRIGTEHEKASHKRHR